jgi:hypothetical protein
VGVAITCALALGDFSKTNLVEGGRRGRKDKGAAILDCALDDRPSTGLEGKWAAGCFPNAAGVSWFLEGGRRRGGSAVGAALMIATFSAIPPRWRVGVAE